MPRECREVDRELKVRRQIREIYCKTAQDFPSGDDWDEYLLLREDIIYRLVNGSKEEVQDTWHEIERYKAHHAESIRQMQRMRPKKVLERMAAVIKSEGNFASKVNADWLDRTALVSNHPFQEQYDSLLGDMPRSPDASLATVGTASPLTPQPLMAGAKGDSARRCSGGGQLSGLSEKKAKLGLHCAGGSKHGDNLLSHDAIRQCPHLCHAEMWQEPTARYWKYTMWCQNESQATQWQITSNEQAKEMLTADIAKATASISSAALHLADIAQYESTDEADLKAQLLTSINLGSTFPQHDAFTVMGLEPLSKLVADSESESRQGLGCCGCAATPPRLYFGDARALWQGQLRPFSSLPGQYDKESKMSFNDLLTLFASFAFSLKMKVFFPSSAEILGAGWHPGDAFAEEIAPKLPEDSGAYSDLGTHREMIEDRVRTEAFREAIFRTCKDKIVLEVGCGTGILSVFAAQAGARRVIAVEANAEMADLAREVVAANSLASSIVILEGAVEEVASLVDEALAHDKADVVLSEWMGFMLVCEDMFPSVAFARDRWLAEGGAMLPARCSLHVAPFSHVSLVERQTGFWGTSPFGVDLSPLAFHALDQHVLQPVIDTLQAEAVLGDCRKLFTLNCKEASAADGKAGCGTFTTAITRPGRLHGLAVWFSCELCSGVAFCTAPEAAATHWEQTLLFFDPASEVMELEVSKGDKIEGELRWLVEGRDLGVVMTGEVSTTMDSEISRLKFGRRLVLNVM
ncbi:PRMT11 [Symbiodinium necroappetens]|uniref:PRMT11 protein n=1 Tax=Symbiodinium necroappetens TaxID=1628268 RepID=A0A813AA59_9DINO|nr:PRMT11 [Symbiodinium necroappetens]